MVAVSFFLTSSLSSVPTNNIVNDNASDNSAEASYSINNEDGSTVSSDDVKDISKTPSEDVINEKVATSSDNVKEQKKSKIKHA